MAGRPTRLLILGGTQEAAALAAAAVARFGAAVEVTTSLAGRTRRPTAPAGALRVGGFGGTDGLARYLTESGTDLLIDATHPFAAEISAHGRAAAARTDRPRLTLARPPWQRRDGDNWIDVADMAAAAVLVAQYGRRVFLTVGVRDLDRFAAAGNVWFLVRLVERPSAPLPLPSHELILARGPFDVAAEAALLRDHAIDLLVTKASGGSATAAKLTAARQAGLPVLMVRRPEPQPGESVDSLDAALSWIDSHRR